MRGLIEAKVTPQEKIIAVNKKFGNSNIKDQQGTTRTLFDSIPLDGRTIFRFFENAQSRQFPLTNLGSTGNRLDVGSTFVLTKAYVLAVVYDAVNNTITQSATLENCGANTLAVPLGTGEFNFYIANSQVIKQLPTSVFYNPTFNPTAVNTFDCALEFATDLVIPPLLEYVGEIKTTTYTAATPYTHLMLVVQGVGGIIAPQTTF
jgi:hypothetical protein